MPLPDTKMNRVTESITSWKGTGQPRAHSQPLRRSLSPAAFAPPPLQNHSHGNQTCRSWGSKSVVDSLTHWHIKYHQIRFLTWASWWKSKAPTQANHFLCVVLYCQGFGSRCFFHFLPGLTSLDFYHLVSRYFHVRKRTKCISFTVVACSC